MSLPFIFANLSGNQPAADLDTNFNAVAQMGSTFCAATGTNAITLVPNAGQPNISAYANDTLFAFNAAATPTSAVTLQVNSLGALNVYYSDGATQVGAGSFIEGQFVIVVYLASLNGGAGGFSFVNGALLSGLLDLQVGDTQGMILYRDSAAWKALAPGTAGQVLTAGGVSANPSWTNAGAATWVLLGSQTVSLATAVQFKSLLSATYSTYKLIYRDVVLSAAEYGLGFQWSVNNGGSYISTANYQFYVTGFNTDFARTALSQGLIGGADTAASTSNPAAGALLIGEATISNPNNTGGVCSVSGFSAYVRNLDSVLGRVSFASGYTGTNPGVINAFQVLPSEGGAATVSGTFTLYGITE